MKAASSASGSEKSRQWRRKWHQYEAAAK